MATKAKLITIKPIQGNNNDIVTLYRAVPIPEFDLSYEKGTNMHIFNIHFQALRGENGYVAFGDPSANSE